MAQTHRSVDGRCAPSTSAAGARVAMAEATFWFSSPFREWIGQRTLTIRWEGRITLREVLDRLAADHAGFRAHLKGGGLQQESFNNQAAVVLDGDFLPLDAVIPDGAKVDVFTPLAGGSDLAKPLLPGRPRFQRASAPANRPSAVILRAADQFPARATTALTHIVPCWTDPAGSGRTREGRIRQPYRRDPASP